MPKIKSHQATLKRFKVAGGKKLKLIKKVCGQDHFNARESGKVTRAKRKRLPIADCEVKGFRQVIPYSV